MAKVVLSAFTDEYSRDIRTQIQLCHELRIPYMEPRFIGDRNVADLNASDAKALKEMLGSIQVSSIGSPLGKINLADDFASHLEKAKRVFETANTLGTPNIRMFSFYLRPGMSRDVCRAEVLDKLGQLVSLAQAFDVVLCHENEADIYGETPDQCLDILDAFEGQMKCVFDMGNFVLGKVEPLNEAYPKLKKYIRYFHIKDALAAGAVVPPGCGEGAIAEILQQYLAEFSRDVIITLEPHLQTFDGLNALVQHGTKFENPYQYESQETAFLDALSRLRVIMKDGGLV